MGIYIQIIATGLAVGAVYGLLAICVSLLFRLTGIVHLAIGELAGMAVFITLLFAYGRDPVASSPASTLSFLGAALAATALVGALGAATYLIIRPLFKAGYELAWIGGIAAVAVTVRGIVEWLFVNDSYVLPDPFDVERLPGGGLISLGGGASLQVRALLVGAVALAVGALATWFLERSRGARALRAITQDRLAAALSGVAVERWLIGAFAIVSALAGAIAIVVLSGSSITPDSGTLLGLKALIVAVAARFGSPRSVLVAGLGLGVLEVGLSTLDIGALELGPAYRDVVPLVVVIVLLAIRGRTSVRGGAA